MRRNHQIPARCNRVRIVTADAKDSNHHIARAAANIACAVPCTLRCPTTRPLFRAFSGSRCNNKAVVLLEREQRSVLVERAKKAAGANSLHICTNRPRGRHATLTRFFIFDVTSITFMAFS